MDKKIGRRESPLCLKTKIYIMVVMFKYFSMDDKRFTLFSGIDTAESRFLRRLVLDIQPSLSKLYNFDYVMASIKSFTSNLSTRLFLTAFQLCQWYKDGRVQKLDTCRADQLKSLFSRGPYNGRPHTGKLTQAQYFIMIFHVLGNGMWNKIVDKYEQYHETVCGAPWLTKDKFVVDSSKPLPVPREILEWINEAYDIPVMSDGSDSEYESDSDDSVMEDVSVASSVEPEHVMSFTSNGAGSQTNYKQQAPSMRYPQMSMNMPASTFPSMHASAQSTPHTENCTNGSNSGSNMTPLHTPYNSVNLDTFGAMAASNQDNRMDVCQQQAVDTSAAFDGGNMPMLTSPLTQRMATSSTPSITAQPSTAASCATASAAQFDMLGPLEGMDTINAALTTLYQHTTPK
ncbi:hypothetical protein EV183_003110 [Coemansia sp. RSA 2336]|nr:hypothetical protein EV183_003110 [Coemansia sp. RSA 2336]